MSSLTPVDGTIARRARLGMPVTPTPRVRLDLIGRASPKPRQTVVAIVVPLPDLPVLPEYAPFNFMARPCPEAIIRLVALKHGYRHTDITGPSRTKQVIAARREAVQLVRSHCKDMSSVALGRIFRKDHSSILNLLGKKSRGRPDA